MGELLLGVNNADEFTIGRHQDANCLIKDVNISRRHAHFKFEMESNCWTVMDNKVTYNFVICYAYFN